MTPLHVVAIAIAIYFARDALVFLGDLIGGISDRSESEIHD